MRMDLVIRFGYGSMVPWVRRTDGLLCAVAGPDALALWTPIETRGEDMTTVAEFTVSATEHIPFVLTWYPSHEVAPRPVDASFAIHDTQMWWDGLGLHVHLRRGVARARHALAHHAEGPHLRAHRRDRRRGDDVAARDARGRAQLGLPLLLAARRHAHPRVAHARRLPRRGPGVARLVAARRGRGRHPAADHVRARRRAAPQRVGGRLAPGLRGLGPGAGGQRRLGPVPAGRLRRGALGPLRRRAAWAAR